MLSGEKEWPRCRLLCELIAASAPVASMTSHYPEPFVDQIYSQLAMAAASQPAGLSVAWAVVCILRILASDSLQPREEQHDTVLVAPPPGLQGLTRQVTQLRVEESNRID